jgi:hypothetical protein
MRANFQWDYDSTFWELREEVSPYPGKLLYLLSQLETRDTELHLIDLDGTLLCDRRRYEVDDHLLNLHGDEAYPYISEKYWSIWDASWFKRFVELLNPSENLLEHDHFYDPQNPDHVILTAWNQEFQTLKIEAGLWKNVKKIIVNEAQDKPLAILEYVLQLGYIPRRIIFVDDRIKNFAWKDTELSKILWNTVIFFQASTTRGDKMVHLTCVTERRVRMALDSANESQFPDRRARV